MQMVRRLFRSNIHSNKLCKRYDSSSRCESSFYDPPYLESMKPKVPLCAQLNVQIRGYDFALVESYQKLVHKVATIMDLDVANGWAVPAKVEKIQKFKPNSSTVVSEYTLNTYERNVQILDLPVNIVPVFIEVIQAGLPQGVSFELHEHLEEHDTIRYVPDFGLKELKTQLESMGGPVKQKK